MNLLDKNAVLAAFANSAKYEEVYFFGIGGALRVRELSGYEMDSIVAACLTGEGKAAKLDAVRLKYSMLAASIIDADGIQMFAEEDLRRLPRGVINRLHDVAQRLNAEGEAREAVAKNSVSEPTGDSGSGSRSRSVAQSESSSAA